MEQLSEPREDREAPEGSSHEMETPEVHKRYFHFCNGAKVTISLSIAIQALCVIRLLCICSQASNKMIDELDLLREQKKILSEAAALQSSSLKRLSDEAAKSSQNEEIKVI